MVRSSSIASLVPIAALLLSAGLSAAEPAPQVDFNRDIRPILSNNCFTCHGPDENERQAGLRLDSAEGVLAEPESGERAVVPGKPDESELVRRVASTDADLRMPPAETGKTLSPREVELLTQWVRQGAPFAKHWSYVKPLRPAVPSINDTVAEVARLRATASHAKRISENAAALENWPKNPIDNFLLDRLLREGLTPSPETDRSALVRRVSLDLTGLPPTLEEVDRFVSDSDPQAYEKLVDRLLDKTAYGEHWARMWLDLARYADSAGYADDPPRTIWAYRDWVIRSFNANQPFDQFTVEQIAGDLLPVATEDQLIATAFHRNTLTNNEGGTNDEEFRNVAVVDRVNTTMAVWMGTTIDCAQCHHHKYDPISQEEYFRLFAILNNSEDADRRDESPFLEIWSDEQKQQKAALLAERDQLKGTVTTATPELLAAQTKWEQRFTREPQWQTLRPESVKPQSGAAATIGEDGSVLIPQPQKTDIYNVELPLDVAEFVRIRANAESTPAQGATNPTSPNSSEFGHLTALRLEALPHDSLPNNGPGHGGGNFVVTRVLASIIPPADQKLSGRYVRIEILGKAKILSLAEVQVFTGAENIAPTGEAKQSSTAFDGPAALATDGKTDGNYAAKSTTHTNTEDDPWWELDLKSIQPVDRIALWNRTDNGLQVRLKDFRVTLLDEQRQSVWEQSVAESPNPSAEFSISGVRNLKFTAAFADFAQEGFAAANVLDGPEPNKTGWAIGPQHGKPHTLTLIPASPVEIAAGSKLSVRIEQLSAHENHTLGHFRLAVTADPDVAEFARTPSPMLAILKAAPEIRTEAQKTELSKYFLTIAEELKPQRDRLAEVEKQLAEMKPATTTPITRELADNRRKTHIQHRGNFLDLGKEVTEGVPAAFHPLPEVEPADRLALARWLVDDENPLTARVIANRYWEAIFGRGLVVTSEEFGSQGELPSHPELLDWLATELVRLKWDRKAFLKLLVTSAAYRQSSRLTPELLERDPENILLARGSRFRLSAEMIRDQALFVGGLLSPKMFGPPVKPPQPQIGLTAAFGSGIDWQTSDGADRYRRGIYTTWRRSNPYPSMAAFDAPNREICTVRRARTNTPLQALVTLNDPVYVEAAQALARRVAIGEGADDGSRSRKTSGDAAQDNPPFIDSGYRGGSTADKARRAFRLCLSRPPRDEELSELVELFEQTYQHFADDSEKARKLATNPLGPAPEGADVAELAAWTVVGNVLLNLDEMFMKR